LALERFGLGPERGAIVVTGAAGGVGSIAVALLARLGWRVAAVTGRPEEEAYITSLGAVQIIARSALEQPGKPLQSRRFAAGVDTVGSVTLANVLSQIDYDGAVAACGNARGMELPASVAPFILRGVSLLGIESVRPRLPLRREAWARLARDLDRAVLEGMCETIPFTEALERARGIVDGKVRGRLVVTMG
jgi:acrylyl-CoA reductase (NADPH)